MANKKQLDLIKQGVEIWNKWRVENTDVIPDFIDADLSDADLSRANFIDADLSGALLIDADLSDADLTEANLTGADLRGANLSRADLSGALLNEANLSRADLSEANLRSADLSGTNFKNAVLREADLANAVIVETVFVNVDFSTVKNLNTTLHFGPSSIGIDTIYKSKGKIPMAFLRGAGVPEDLIKCLDSTVVKNIKYYSCFISYSSKDQQFADRLHADLQDNGVRCWIAPKDMNIGDPIRDSIYKAIEEHDKLLLILSEYSIDSEWVENEVETAFAEERKRKETALFPIRLDSSVMKSGKAWAKTILQARHIGDFSEWGKEDKYKKSLDRLLKDLEES